MRELTRTVDARVDGWFDHLRGHKAADWLFYSLSAIADFGALWVVLAIMRGVRGGEHAKRAAVRAVIATGAESVLVNAVMKSFFGRRRPGPAEARPLPLRQPLTSSFPSGHATAAFCAATLLSEQDRFGPFYFGLASLVAASRVHVKIHHASDVIAGAVVGLALGQIGRRIAPLSGAPQPTEAA
jgi:undecaprenyl-diphosphatase